MWGRVATQNGQGVEAGTESILLPGSRKQGRCDFQSSSAPETSVTFQTEPEATFRLSHRAFHLKFDQTVHLDGIFHRKFFDKWLNETTYDHSAGFGFGKATALEVK